MATINSGRPTPQVERVPARRGTTLAVGLIAVALVALLIWKPWDQPPPSPSAAAVLPTAVPSSIPSVAPTSGPNVGPVAVSPTPSLPPLPTPDFAPLQPLGHIALSDDGSAHARCIYGMPNGGLRTLESIEVRPPFVAVPVNNREVPDIERFGWRVELQMNRLEKMFEREWQTVARSRRQLARAIADQPASFAPLTIARDAQEDPPTAVYRVVVIVEWYTRNAELAGVGELRPTSYAAGNRVPARYEGCHAVRATA